MTFEEYLVSKKIDSKGFKESEPERWEEWSTLFSMVHPNNFTTQKLNLINSIRRKYKLKEEEIVSDKASAKPAAKPVMRPKPKFK